MRKSLLKATVVAMGLVAFGATGALAGPKVVSGPGVLPECFKPLTDKTKFFQWAPHKAPFRIAVANGFVGNTWRIQMIKTAKTFAEDPSVKGDIKELKVVSTGTDVAAQIGAIENFINDGFDGIVTIAVNPTAFGPVIKKANKANVVLVPFDNIIDTDELMEVNENQRLMGQMMGEWLVKEIPSHKGDILEIRGLPGNSVDRDRHLGFRDIMEKAGNKFNITEVVGNWDDGTAQKVAADALAVHKHFDGMYVQGGSTGAVRAFMDAHHPFIPVAGEGENGFRKLCAQHDAEGLKCASAGQSPGLVAIAMKAAISALKGNVMPQFTSVPIPYVESGQFKAGDNYYPDLTDNFFDPNEFPPCGVNIKATDIMAKTEANQ